MKIGTSHRGMPRALIAAAMLALPMAAVGQIGPNTNTTWGVDDYNTSTLIPQPAQVVYSCPWVDTGLTNAGFTPANNWNFTYAGAAASAFSVADLSILTYRAWTVTSGNVTGQDGRIYRRPIIGEDAGGADFQVKYTPAGTDPVNVHFIQAYNQSLNGGAFTSHLDNLGGALPWYDALGVSGISTLPGNASWMLDIPFDRENEIEDYHTDVQFQVFLATETVNAGVHNVKLYSGIWWGYQYSTFDVPAPGSVALLAFGGVFAARRRRA